MSNSNKNKNKQKQQKQKQSKPKTKKAQPKRKAAPRGLPPGTIRLTGRDHIMSPMCASVPYLSKVLVNPGVYQQDNCAFPTSYLESRNYTEWKLESLKLSYEPSVGDQTNGTILMGHVDNSNAGLDQSFTSIFNQPNMSKRVVTRSFDYHVPRSALPKQWLKVRTANVPDRSDFDPLFLFVGSANGADVQAGQVSVTYSFLLRNRMTTNDITNLSPSVSATFNIDAINALGYTLASDMPIVDVVGNTGLVVDGTGIIRSVLGGDYMVSTDRTFITNLAAAGLLYWYVRTYTAEQIDPLVGTNRDYTVYSNGAPVAGDRDEQNMSVTIHLNAGDGFTTLTQSTGTQDFGIVACVLSATLV